ncbi:E3 ubiquitin-protein ligase TRIM71-like isoform X1 [Folsomia candida]|nr:E3 ubiquitin-protein ligase TRIM71-like isoform X1 [Folsomia candida]
MAMSRNVFGNEWSTPETNDEKFKREVACIVEILRKEQSEKGAYSNSPDRSSSDNYSTEESSPTSTTSSAASFSQQHYLPPYSAAASPPYFEEFDPITRQQLGTSFSPISSSTLNFDPCPTANSGNGNLWEENLEPLLSQSVYRADNSIPLYCRRSRFQQLDEIQQPAEFMPIPPISRSYIFTGPEGPSVAREEVRLHLKPRNVSANPQTQQMPQNSVLNAYAKISHSSGYTSCFPLRKFDATPDSYNCSFVPFYAGKYSASVFESSSSEISADSHLNGREGQLCPSVELEVSRNYRLESQSPPVAPISLGENGEKYWGITVDQLSNRLYISDRSTNDIILFDTVTSTPIHRFGGLDLRMKFPCNQLSRPTGLVLDYANKRLIICDKDNHRVCIYSLEGQYISSFGRRGHGPGEFQYPWDVDVSPNGNLIAISDSRNHRVQVFDRFGNFLAKFSVFEQNPYQYKQHFDYPRGVSFSKDGRHIYVTDFNTSKMIRIEVDSGSMKFIGPKAQLSRLQGLTVDELGNMIVCDSRKNCVRIFSEAGSQYQIVNSVGWNKISMPVDACIMRDGVVAILCLNGNICFV